MAYKVIYEVVGRYMEGQNVVGYHLNGSDGSSAGYTKEVTLSLAHNGLIANMRVQNTAEGMILRGYGVNLNNLPIHRSKKEETHTEKERASVSVARLSMLKRIVSGGECIGYIVFDKSTGKELKLERAKAIELARKGTIDSVIVRQVRRPGAEGGTDVDILSGVGFSVDSLPCVIVDKAGNLIDTSDRKSIKFRYYVLKKAGILHNLESNSGKVFQDGDVLICGINGELKVVSGAEFISRFEVDRGSTVAICDHVLDNLNKHPIELFGMEKKCVPASQVLKWGIVRMKSQ